MKKTIAIIPAAGRGSRMLSLTDNCPKAMLPLHNKPIIGWHLDKLIDEGIKDVCIIVGYKKEKLIEYVNNVYGDKLNITYAEQKQLLGLAHAIGCGINELAKKYVSLEPYSLLIILGDTIIKDNLSHLISKEESFVGYNIVDDYSRWCLMLTDENENIIKFIDKPDHDPITRKAVIGIYYFHDILTLNMCINYIIERDIKIKNEYQLSSAMTEYLNIYKTIKSVQFKEWYDCGEVETFNNTRKNITRHFNSINITDDNTIIKKSSNKKKIIQEINWYLNIPNKLRIYTPQLIDYSHNINNTFYELEYVNFSPMQELFLYNLPEISEWDYLFKKTFHMINKFKEYSNKTIFNTSEHVSNIILNKTEDRINDTITNNKYFANVYSYDNLLINGKSYKNIKTLLPELRTYINNNIVNNSSEFWQIIHGDLFFGNMLYDVNSKTLKIIDPRGNFDIDGIYGDIRYDIAKLMHSITGKYDFIVNDLFAMVKETDNSFEYLLYDSKKHIMVEELFHKYVVDEGYNLNDITIITGLLFISMIPLHSENINHQKMFYLIGIQILNKVLGE